MKVIFIAFVVILFIGLASATQNNIMDGDSLSDSVTSQASNWVRSDDLYFTFFFGFFLLLIFLVAFAPTNN